MDILAPDVVLITDGGGVKKAALHPIPASPKALRFLIGVMPADGSARIEYASRQRRSRDAAAQLATDLDTIATVRFDGDRVSALYLVRNPDKLRAIDREFDLSR